MTLVPKLIKIAAYTAVTLYVLFVAALYALQRPMLFAASPDAPSPSAFGLSDTIEGSIDTFDGEKLAAWYQLAAPARPTVLFFHGKGGNLTHRQGRWKAYAARGYGILFFDYRGFGKSSGSPSETGLKTDAIAAYDWLRQKGVPASSIVLTAESLGTGLAIYTASQRDVAGVSFMSAYSSIADVAADRYWFAPVRLLIKDPLNMLPYAAQLKAPVLQQHGTADTTIPLAIGEKLFAAIASPKEMVRVPRLGHNNFGDAEFEREFAFIEGLQRK